MRLQKRLDRLEALVKAQAEPDPLNTVSRWLEARRLQDAGEIDPAGAADMLGWDEARRLATAARWGEVNETLGDFESL